MLILCFLLAGTSTAFAEKLWENPVLELYSADGFYTDSVGNASTYAYHVPQINDDTEAAKEINLEIAKRFGKNVEGQFRTMEGGFSLSAWNIGWHGFWYGSQLFLVVSSDTPNDCMDYAAYGYDFETREKVTNRMILEELGLSEEEYLTNLKEKVQLMFEGTNGIAHDQIDSYESMLQMTLDWADIEAPMFIDAFGSIETIVKIGTFAGAGWYYHFATPFSYG